MITRTKTITSSTVITLTSTSLLSEVMNGLLSNLSVEIIDEDLDHKNAVSNIYVTRNKNLLAEPRVRVRRIDNTGSEILLFLSTDYTIDLLHGEITLATSTPDIIRVDYFYQPLTDSTLDELMAMSIQEISNLVYRSINPASVQAEYKSVIKKRFLTNALRNLMNETRDYFSIGIAGRSLSKNTVPDNFKNLIENNEEQLQSEIHVLRYNNNSNRIV